jgi:hypothetical protein
MNIQLTEGVLAEIIDSGYLGRTPRYMLRSGVIIVGSYFSPAEHERHIGGTLGPHNWLGMSGTDELRFEPTTLFLESIQFELLETHQLASDIAPQISLNSSSHLKGGIRLLAVPKFGLEHAAQWWISPSRNLLIGFISDVSIDKIQLQLEIAPDFSLLFTEGSYCGWVLRNPVQYIVSGWEHSQSFENSSAELNRLLRRYYWFIQVENVMQMENGDPNMLKQMVEFRNELETQGNTSHPANVIQSAINDIIDTFYE